MKKFTFLSLLVLPFLTFSQISYDWGIAEEGTLTPDNAYSETVIDDNGYRYSVGYFNDTLT